MIINCCLYTGFLTGLIALISESVPVRVREQHSNEPSHKEGMTCTMQSSLTTLFIHIGRMKLFEEILTFMLQNVTTQICSLIEKMSVKNNKYLTTSK